MVVVFRGLFRGEWGCIVLKGLLMGNGGLLERGANPAGMVGGGGVAPKHRGELRELGEHGVQPAGEGEAFVRRAIYLFVYYHIDMSNN